VSLFLFSAHAVTRFVERHRPGMSPLAATHLLEAHAPTAVRLRDLSRSGHPTWRLPELDVVFVGKPTRTRDLYVVATVLPRAEAIDDDLTDEIIAAARRQGCA
jgi:hypothetical protein